VKFIEELNIRALRTVWVRRKFKNCWKDSAEGWGPKNGPGTRSGLPPTVTNLSAEVKVQIYQRTRDNRRIGSDETESERSRCEGGWSPNRKHIL